MNRRKCSVVDKNSKDMIEELATVLKNVPNRASIEWQQKRKTHRKDITGALALCAVNQSPYEFPVGLEHVIGWLGACLKQDLHWDKRGFVLLSLNDISDILYKTLTGMKEFDAWNVPRKGKGTDIIFVSPSIPLPKADEDFIDLDALIKNVCCHIRDKRATSDVFIKQFKAKQPKPKGDKPDGKKA